MLCQPRIRFPRAAGASYSPAQLAALYGCPKVTVPDPRKPFVIGIISLGGGHKPHDAAVALARQGLPAPAILDVPVQGGRNTPGDPADVENAMDIQVSASWYSFITGLPAMIRFYSAPNTDAGFTQAVRQAYEDECAAISISWGAAEDNWSDAARRLFEAVCADATSNGSVVCAASGDNLSADGLADGRPHVDFPAACPHVVGCGGTTKTAAGETVWNSGGGGTGGGYSTAFPTQAFQVGAPSKAGRMVPDVAGNADPATGWQVVVNGQVTVVGGTSAVAPMYAGLFAAIAAAAGKKLGNVLPALYSRPAAFADITTGNNGQYRAQTGPDPCTGLGVPIGTALLALLVGSPPPVTPPLPPPPPQPPGVLPVKVNVPIPPLPVYLGSTDSLVIGHTPARTVVVEVPGQTVHVAASPEAHNALLDHLALLDDPDFRLHNRLGIPVVPTEILDVLKRIAKREAAIVAGVLRDDLLALVLGRKTWKDVLDDVLKAVVGTASFPNGGMMLTLPSCM